MVVGLSTDGMGYGGEEMQELYYFHINFVYTQSKT